MTFRKTLFLLACLTAAHTCVAGDLLLFKASEAGPDAWAWSQGRIKLRDGVFVAKEYNPSEEWGDVFVADRFPFFPAGEVELDIAAVPVGAYTLQVLGFKGSTHDDTVALTEDSTITGVQRFRLADAGLDPAVTHVLFKLWLTGAEGATTHLRDLTYRVPDASEHIGQTIDFRTVGAWEAEDGLVMDTGMEGATLTVAASSSFGSILYDDPIERKDSQYLVIELGSLEKGELTVQCIAFDADGRYIASVDAIKTTTAGYHAMPIGGMDWPEGTKSYALKIWLSGTPEVTTAQVRRFFFLGR
jgi:hypothetical protein